MSVAFDWLRATPTQIWARQGNIRIARRVQRKGPNVFGKKARGDDTRRLPRPKGSEAVSHDAMGFLGKYTEDKQHHRKVIAAPWTKDDMLRERARARYNAYLLSLQRSSPTPCLFDACIAAGRQTPWKDGERTRYWQPT